MGEDSAEKQEAEGTPEAILRSTVARYNELSLEADEELYRNRNSDGSAAKYRERTQLIADLPDKIKAAKLQGHSFPDNAMVTLFDFAGMADEALKSNSSFAMGVLLIDKGTKIGEPNNLEKLIERTYPVPQVADTPA